MKSLLGLLGTLVTIVGVGVDVFMTKASEVKVAAAAADLAKKNATLTYAAVEYDLFQRQHRIESLDYESAGMKVSVDQLVLRRWDLEQGDTLPSELHVIARGIRASGVAGHSTQMLGMTGSFDLEVDFSYSYMRRELELRHLYMGSPGSFAFDMGVHLENFHPDELNHFGAIAVRGAHLRYEDHGLMSSALTAQQQQKLLGSLKKEKKAAGPVGMYVYGELEKFAKNPESLEIRVSLDQPVTVAEMMSAGVEKMPKLLDPTITANRPATSSPLAWVR